MMNKGKYSKLIGCTFFIAKQSSSKLIFPIRAVFIPTECTRLHLKKYLLLPKSSVHFQMFSKFGNVVQEPSCRAMTPRNARCYVRVCNYRILKFRLQSPSSVDLIDYHRSDGCRNTYGIHADVVIVVRRPSGRATRAFRQTPASFFYFWPDPVVGIGEKTLAVRFSGVKGPARASRRFVHQVRFTIHLFILLYIYTHIYVHTHTYMCVCVCVYVCVCVRVEYHFRFSIFVLLRYPPIVVI